ncbi:MAG: site-specific integrase [Vicinamibacteria bacterium]|nr:site-specific integrase [Vicinamibacteria bacterium]
MRGDGFVYQRGSAWWVQYRANGQRIREAARIPDKDGVLRPATTEAEARRYLRARRADVLGGRFLSPQAARLSVADLLDALETHLAAKGIRSLAKVRCHAKALRSFFALERAAEVTPASIERFKAERRAAGRAAATVNRELEILRQAYRLAVRHRHLAPPNVPAIDMLPVDNVRQGFFTPKEISALLPHLEPDLRDFVEWASLTGQRKGEASALAWAMLDRSGAVWVFQIPATIAKNKHGRTLPVVGVARSVIERRLQARRLGLDLVFHRTSKGKPGQPVALFDKAWRNALKAAGLPSERLFHDLRRSAARNLRRAGASETESMRVTGHKTPSMFRRYSITTDDEVAAALQRVDDAIAKGHI